MEKIIIGLLFVCMVFTSCSGDDSPNLDNSELDNAKNIIQGQVISEGMGVSGVVVSDGYNTILTDESGLYEIKVNSSADFVFISLPSTYKIPNKDGIATFFKNIRNVTDKQNVDFVLEKNAVSDSKHAMIVWADPQIKTSASAKLLNYNVAPLVKSYIEEIDDIPVCGISVGDLVEEKFDLFPDYINAVDKTGIPFFQVVGNHDLDYSTSSQKLAEKKFISYFGPTYYSFNRGKIHYVVLNDISINYNGSIVDPNDKYHGDFTDTQLEWLKKDLKYIEQGSTIFVAFHIPYFKLSDEIKGKLAEIIKPYKVHIISGHTHYNQNVEEDNIFEHTIAALCATWWNSELCSDGTPAGYGVFIADGDEISWIYKPTDLPSDFQVKLFAPGYSDEYPTRTIANVWNWDPEWVVEWYENDTYQGKMIQYSGYDPEAYVAMYGPDLPVNHTSIEPKKNNHMFYAMPSNNASNISVKVTDRFGKVYSRSVDVE